MYTKMNKAKVLIFLIIFVICASLITITALAISISSKFKLDINLNDYVEVPSYVQNTESMPQKYLVVDIVDGDTIKIMENGKKATVRLIGIDAPEVKEKECMYSEATQELEELILNQEVTLQKDSSQDDLDRYGRELRYVFFNSTNVNEYMVSKGFATEYTYNKPYTYQSQFFIAQINAQSNNLGIWSTKCTLKRTNHNQFYRA